MGVTPLPPFVKESSLSLALCFLQPDDGDAVAAMAPSSMGAQGPHPVTQIGARASPTALDITIRVRSPSLRRPRQRSLHPLEPPAVGEVRHRCTQSDRGRSPEGSGEPGGFESHRIFQRRGEAGRGTIQRAQFDPGGDTGAFGEGSRCGAVCE